MARAATVNEVAAQNVPRYMQVKNLLRSDILSGRYAVGARLPSVRQLCKDFGLSFPTAHRAIRELAQEGLIQARSGAKGTIVLANEIPVAARPTTIACLLRPHRPRNEDDNFAVDMLQGVRNAISSHQYRFVYHCLDEMDYEERMVRLVKEEWVCGILLDQRTPPSTIHRLLEAGLPAVLMNCHEPFPGLSSVAPDYERIAREGVRMLLSKGYRRIGFASLYSDMVPLAERITSGEYPTRMMAHGVRAAAQAHGIASQAIHWIVEPSRKERLPDTPEAYGLPRRKPADWQPLGFVTDTDRRAVNLMNIISMTDLVPGRDVGVIGMIDLPAGQRYVTPPSTWRIDPVALGESAVAQLISCIENPQAIPAVVKVPAEFIDRGTF